ncbi:MAG: TetR/AcrR family transcriptional regulator [Mariniphaga sp.]|nr:TetR/AcrR family transcriptional regulator [Mariniphaga sp.]
MNTIKKDNTEQKILNAAQNVFMKKGMDGSRMQEIADEAGINKALLHYYFRTKQKLFEAIFKRLFKKAFPSIREMIFSDLPFDKKIETFIDKYMDILLKNPYLPLFILKEINRDPQFLASVIRSQGVNPTEVFKSFEKEMEKGTIRKMDPKDLLINMLALSIFPIAARPLMTEMFFNGNKNEYKKFLLERKNTVKEFILNSILIK